MEVTGLENIVGRISEKVGLPLERESDSLFGENEYLTISYLREGFREYASFEKKTKVQISGELDEDYQTGGYLIQVQVPAKFYDEELKKMELEKDIVNSLYHISKVFHRRLVKRKPSGNEEYGTYLCERMYSFSEEGIEGFVENMMQ